ncbi:TOMM precursor leader peptide-binding protein [Streptomyces lydicus]|nr:TOMM precursor leader peptide-binding protein [Streptomyces lydicus]
MTDAATAARTGRLAETLHPARTADPATAPRPRRSRRPVAVLGKGVLASSIRAALARTHPLVAEEDPACAAVVTAEDRWVTATEPPRPDVPWLPVRVELGLLVVGPTTVRAGRLRPVCPDAPAAGSRQDSPRAALLGGTATSSPGRASPVLTTWACETTAALVTDELSATAGRLTDSALAFLSLTTMAIDVHRFLPDPACSWCGGLPADRPPDLMGLPRPKPRPDIPRVRDLRAGWEELVARYVDGRTGLIRQLDVRTDYPYPMVSARCTCPAGAGGRVRPRPRLCGVRPHRARRSPGTAGRGPSRRAPDDGAVRLRGDRRPGAVPLDLGLYPPERYAEPDFPYPPYAPDLELNWVWGHSFARDAPVLVPEDYAYYRTRHGNPAARPLAYEVSNGCALGGCLEEAALHGLVELAERDAFLLTWYARLPVPRVDLRTVSDPRVGALAERIRQDSGHRVLAFATTPEHGIPTAWVMAVGPRGPGRPDEPAAVCAAGAHFDPECALRNGLLELAANLGWNRAAFRAERDRIAAMVDEPDLVREMRDHALLYCHPAAFDRFAFLLGDDGDWDRGGLPVEEAFARATCRPRGADIRDDLAEAVARFTDRGSDVVVVDQTTDEHRAGGLACAKVIVPGLLPMTFGHRMRRTHGLPRLLDLPSELGYRRAPLAEEEINPHPHPFP